MKETYEINKSTLAVVPIDENRSRVLEETTEYIVNKSSFEIIEDSCKYFGSTYQGRYDGTKNLIGMSYKLPIIIEESRNIIFFPTSSPRTKECAWIALTHLDNYINDKNDSYISFKNGYKLKVNVSIFALENQILRASRLESVLRSRKMS